MADARHLVSQRREVPVEREAAYALGWEAVRRRAVARGAHAWRFTSTTDPRLYLEFLEFAAEDDPRADPEIVALLDALATLAGTAVVDEWRES